MNPSHPVWSGLTRALARASMGHNLARPSHPNYTVRVGPAPRPPALAGTGHAPAHPSRRNWWREWRRGTSPTCVPAATMATCAMPRLSGPGRAGWPAGASPRADGSAVPAFLVGTPGPAPGSVLALTGSDSSESGHSCPRPASVSRSGWRGQLAPARYPRPVPGAIARKGSGHRWPLPRVLSRLPAAVRAAT